MDIIKSGLKSVLGAPQDCHNPTGAETVERLVERVNTSTLLDDRRDACRGLKALSKKYRLEVGCQAMDAFLQVLDKDRSDSELVGYVLDAVCNVITGFRDEDDVDNLTTIDGNLGFQFTEIFIKKNENVTLLLDLMEEFDFRVRWPVVKLLTSLLVHKPKELQDCILISPMGVSRLMDLLSDTREIIRNDTLLLLAHLTKGNANIQKIVAFESAFDKLLSIIREEEYSDGGVIVEDCLIVLQTLLKNNSSNQTYFREGSYIQHLAPFFQFQETAEMGWTAQKVSNIHLMLLVLRVLVSPNNPQQITLSAQKAMFQCGLLEQLCNTLMAAGVPADILAETINAVAEILRGNHSNQEYFSKINAPTEQPRAAIVVLLMTMVNDKQLFSLRCAVLYCFQCFVYKNEHCQAQIVQTLLPSSADAGTFTAGQLLCGGLFNPDVISNWLSAIALSHVLVDSPTQKEQLLRVQLSAGVGNPPVSLISQISIMLQKAERLQTRLGLLMLLCTWLAHCPHAVKQFLGIETNIPFLTSQVGLMEHDESEDMVRGICAFLLGICIEFNDNTQDIAPNSLKEDLCHLVEKRIGLETFVEKLNSVSKNEHYNRASQHPHIKFKQPNEVLFDYEFCRLFKSLEGVIIKAVQPRPLITNGPEAAMTPCQQEHLKKYQDLIREQDLKISNYESNLRDITTEYEYCNAQLEDLTGTVQQLRDQNALLKAQKAVSGSNLDVQVKEELEKSRSQLDLHNKEIVAKQQIKAELDLQLQDLTNQLTKLNSEYEEVKSRADQVAPPVDNSHTLQSEIQESALKESMVKLQAELELQQEESAGKDQIIAQLREAILSSAQSVINSSSSNAAELQSLNESISNLQVEVETLRKTSKEFDLLKESHVGLQKEKDDLQNSLLEMQKEHEDMLVLVTEQGDKMTTYKSQLKELGFPVEDDYEDDDVDENAWNNDDMDDDDNEDIEKGEGPSDLKIS